ncbi:hypothetical protein BJ508DRAFT_330893 [Ascobolus immersus RN42]|uniref:Uncharacterized protein n=1 Tax=Ascobolus immersus RN42 TaxID=1160509 RepID=A0A3N4HS42_ASCIM|nr:hypothetical protein BJ508DRAFT_330893 [Ascobolus immersus RN42]
MASPHHHLIAIFAASSPVSNEWLQSNKALHTTLFGTANANDSQTIEWYISTSTHEATQPPSHAIIIEPSTNAIKSTLAAKLQALAKKGAPNDKLSLLLFLPFITPEATRHLAMECLYFLLPSPMITTIYIEGPNSMLWSERLQWADRAGTRFMGDVRVLACSKPGYFAQKSSEGTRPLEAIMELAMATDTPAESIDEEPTSYAVSRLLPPLVNFGIQSRRPWTVAPALPNDPRYNQPPSPSQQALVDLIKLYESVVPRFGTDQGTPASEVVYEKLRLSVTNRGDVAALEELHKLAERRLAVYREAEEVARHYGVELPKEARNGLSEEEGRYGDEYWKELDRFWIVERACATEWGVVGNLLVRALAGGGVKLRTRRARRGGGRS